MIVAIFTHISASFFILLCFNSCIPYFEYIIKDSPTERFAAPSDCPIELSASRASSPICLEN